MKRKTWLRRNALSTPKMTIRTDLPWATKVLAWALAAAVGAGAATFVIDMRSGAFASAGAAVLHGKVTPAELQEQVDKLTIERDRLATAANEAESRLNIERAAQKPLATQIKALELENTRLKEDLAFFDSLLPTATGPQGVSIRRLKIDQPGPNQLHYQILVMQGGKGDVAFSGTLQLALSATQAGKPAMMVFPDIKAGDASKYKLGFKHYQRLDGVITVPDGLIVKSVQARVLEKGQMRTQQSANL